MKATQQEQISVVVQAQVPGEGTSAGANKCSGTGASQRKWRTQVKALQQEQISVVVQWRAQECPKEACFFGQWVV